MPRLLLLRHAKSSWDDPACADFDRPLAPRGHRACALISRFLSDNALAPDRILCSPARRTKETLEGIRSGLPVDTEVALLQDLYDLSDGDYVATIAANASDAQMLLVIGHNNATADTARRLTTGDPSALCQKMLRKFPTGAIAVLDFEDAWQNLRNSRARLLTFVRPRDLDGPEPFQI